MVARAVYNLVRWCNARRREGDGPRARLPAFVPDALLHSVWNLTMPDPHRVKCFLLLLLDNIISYCELASSRFRYQRKSIPPWMRVLCDVTEGTCMSLNKPHCLRQDLQPGVGLRPSQEPIGSLPSCPPCRSIMSYSSPRNERAQKALSASIGSAVVV